MKKKIYCFNNGGSSGWYEAVALAEDGHFLAGHICSHEGYMAHDLGITSNWKHDNYNKHFGEGNWELEWIDRDKLESHEGLNKAIALNATLTKEEHEKDAEAAPKVIIEVAQ